MTTKEGIASLIKEIDNFKYFDKDLNQLVDNPMIPGAGALKNGEAAYAFSREKDIVNKLLTIEKYLQIKSEFYKIKFKEENIFMLSLFKLGNLSPVDFATEYDFDFYLKVYNELFELI